jgi:hypothetical protein
MRYLKLMHRYNGFAPATTLFYRDLILIVSTMVAELDLEPYSKYGSGSGYKKMKQTPQKN